jgi:hypothetical protein
MAKTSLYQVFVLVLLCFTAKAWWPFESGKVADPPTEVKNDKGEKTGEFLRNSPVPFEMSVAEQKFLAEAQRYMGDMSALDQCHQVVSMQLTVFDWKTLNERRLVSKDYIRAKTQNKLCFTHTE